MTNTMALTKKSFIQTFASFHHNKTKLFSVITVIIESPIQSINVNELSKDKSPFHLFLFNVISLN